ncbi:hypothetical protein VTL71DRAFT_5699 [Oculimacula yallundae]|uniref:Uncharacterized protein n=1 Tax=Oculimacula yallundae TaxID=86028 RepID=A0ABR4BZ73_9HELO
MSTSVPESRETHQEVILSTAKLGEDLSVHLVKFSARFNTNHLGMLNLSTAIGLISGNLETLSSTIQTFGPTISLDDNLTTPLVASLRAIFEKVQRALDEATEADKAHGDDFDEPQSMGEIPVNRQDARRALRNHAGVIAFGKVLGGYAQAETLVWFLETLKGHVFFLAKGIKYLALKKMEEDDTLDNEQKSALKKLEKEALQVGRELGWRKFALEVITQKWKAGEDLTVAGRLSDRERDDVEIIPRRDVDFDARSISSFGSNASNVYIDAKEIYESWLIRKFDTYVRKVQRHWSVLGLKFYENWDTENFSAEPMPCSQDELKRKYEHTNTAESQKTVEKMIRQLPAWVHREIECLVNERTRNSKAENLIRTWSVLDATPAPSVIPGRQTGGWFGWFKREPEVSGWMVVLKVESSEAEGMLCTNPTGDPFRKYPLFRERRYVPDYRGQRDYSPEREREVVIEPRRNVRSTRRVVEATVPTADATHKRIKDIMDGILAVGKDSPMENPFVSVGEDPS